MESSFWQELPGVPAGGKNLRDGSGLVALHQADTTRLYLLKGSGTREFYRYNTLSRTWEARNPAPIGASGKPYKGGSCLAVDAAAGFIYALKGKYGEFWVYDPTSNAWTECASLPLVGRTGRKKRPGKGTCMFGGVGTIYLLKGGSDECWSYINGADQWIEAESLPCGVKRRKVGAGASLVYAESRQAFYALRGNGTRELWECGPAVFGRPQAPGRNPQTTGAPQSAFRDPQLAVSPNPFTSATTISYSLPAAGIVRLKLYDITGQLVSTLASGYDNAGASSLKLQASSLSAGIYILKLSTETSTLTQKLIIE